MDLDRRQKYQVVFLIDKSLKNIRSATNSDEGSQQRNSSHKSSEEVSSSPESKSQNREFDDVPCCHLPKSYTWKSISVSSFRILSYLFSQIQPHVSLDHDTSNSASDVSSNLNSRLSGAVSHLVGYSSNQCNDTNDCSAENFKEQSQQIVYLKRKQASLQWGYKFFDSGKLTGKTEHHQFNDFKLRHFEEFEKELQRQFEDDDGSTTSTQPRSKVDSKVNIGGSSERRKSNTPSAAECLKRTLSSTVYDFHWESPDITSPVRKIGRSSIRSSRKHNSITTRDTSPHNLVFLFRRCPTSKMEFKDFAAKLVVDSEVFLDSFMPPALFREFRVNRNLSLYWIDQDWLKHEEKERNVLHRGMNCVCGEVMVIQKFKRNKDGHIWRCNCTKTRSIKSGTFFGNSNIGISEIMQLMFLWTIESPVSSCEGLVGVSCVSAKKWYQYFRDVTSWKLLHIEDKLGDNGGEVQLDESLMLKRKNHQGRVVQQFWVFGIYDSSRKKGYLRFVNDRSADTLIPIVQQWVAPGATVVTGDWHAYNGLAALNYTHLTVNHSRDFVEPVTNNVQAFWQRMKKPLKRTSGASGEMKWSHLDERLYRHWFDFSTATPLQNLDVFLSHISERYPV